MYSAKAGKSTLGIPQSVGAKMVKDDPGGKLPSYSSIGSPRGYAKGGPIFRKGNK